MNILRMLIKEKVSLKGVHHNKCSRTEHNKTILDTKWIKYKIISSSKVNDYTKHFKELHMQMNMLSLKNKFPFFLVSLVCRFHKIWTQEEIHQSSCTISSGIGDIAVIILIVWLYWFVLICCFHCWHTFLNLQWGYEWRW